ncbi:MAG: hypothetical protein HY721_23930 [Planctomycetes bacterium]|nr:hypothetical protein [Planctomycetota bacterium]
MSREETELFWSRLLKVRDACGYEYFAGKLSASASPFEREAAALALLSAHDSLWSDREPIVGLVERQRTRIEDLLQAAGQEERALLSDLLKLLERPRRIDAPRRK